MQSSDWYYCLDHHRVEPYEGCRSASRLGPYRTIEEAQVALATVAQRNEQWDNDPRFSDDDREQPERHPAEDRRPWPFEG